MIPARLGVETLIEGLIKHDGEMFGAAPGSGASNRPFRYCSIVILAVYYGAPELAFQVFSRDLYLAAIRFGTLSYPLISEVRSCLNSGSSSLMSTWTRTGESMAGLICADRLAMKTLCASELLGEAFLQLLSIASTDRHRVATDETNFTVAGFKRHYLRDLAQVDDS